jgi:hypothetical protein
MLRVPRHLPPLVWAGGITGAVVGGNPNRQRFDMWLSLKVEAVFFGCLCGAALALAWPLVLAGGASEVLRRLPGARED